MLLGRWRHPLSHEPTGLSAFVAAIQRKGLFATKVIEWLDASLRQWPIATLFLVVLAIVFGAAVMGL